ncbi:hypothetical protein [Pedococcus sp. 5OH_020]|uniref:hypothetical protein n=1 Tax=Pedococcus sp. 5OH_020 TaxID=2989814 RepID=UPI0022E9BEC0|nr:hypothetical protein [Pedococcus sp. 5OH_020]
MSSRIVRVPVEELDQLLVALERMEQLQSEACPSGFDPCAALEGLATVYAACRRFIQLSALSAAQEAAPAL